jgi:hypothetical protein
VPATHYKVSSQLEGATITPANRGPLVNVVGVCVCLGCSGGPSGLNGLASLGYLS